MMWVVYVLVIWAAFLTRLSFAEPCSACDPTCGNWSCITNCSESTTNPTFNTYRCAVDSNSNGQIDDCSELPACQYINGKYVCPTDLGDSLCTSSDWRGPTPYDLSPGNFDTDTWGVYITSAYVGYYQYQNLLSWYSLSCAPTSSQDSLYYFISQNYGLPVWVCGGALYGDGWFSFDTCSYTSFDGSLWKVKNNACWDPNKIWQKLGPKCYVTSWNHTFYVYKSNTWYSTTLTWYVYTPQNTFNQTQYVYLAGDSYSINLRCVSSTTVRDELSGNYLTLCTQFTQRVYNSSGSLLYSLNWYVDTSWPCYSYSRSQQSGNFYDTMSAWPSSQFYVVVFERQNNVSLRGVGVDRQGTRCRICSTSMTGLGGGTLNNQWTENPSPPINTDPRCTTPRFFSGENRTCRSGGITVLGASCCGISGIFSGICSRSERELKKKRQAGLCTEVGSFCSKRIRIPKICLERRRSFCCFNSSFARTLQECGRPQIGKSWGDPRNPNCSGYTIDEFASVDFTDERCSQAIESWAQGIAQSVGDSTVQNIAGSVNSRVQSWINNVKNTKDYGGEK